MGFYKPLFTVAVEHGYFADGGLRELEFVASSDTRRLVDGAGLLLKPHENGIGMFYDEAREEALRLYAEDADGVLYFAFKVRARDRGLANYTSPSISREGAVLCFESRDVPTAAGREWLGREALVSDADFTDMDGLVSLGVLGERDRRTPPDFVLLLHMKRAEGGAWKARDFGIRFGARRSFWKYHLLGNMNRDGIFIVDLDNRVQFEPCGEVALPGNRTARVFKSKERIPLLEKSDCRFQLREQGNGSGKVLVKRLPVASESRLGLEVIDGKKEIVLESYVNY